MDKLNFDSKILFGDLHLHLGGAVTPRILWHRIMESEKNIDLLEQFQDYDHFERFFSKKRRGLTDYLKMFDVVEPLQTIDRLEYFIKRIMRGVFVFENLSYLELRYCPYSRTSRDKSEKERIKDMEAIVLLIDKTVKEYNKYYPVIIKQILCMHSQNKYSANVNSAILDLAIKHKGIVCGIDIAGGEKNYKPRFDEIFNNYKRAYNNGLNTTAHLFETHHTPIMMTKLFPYLKRIGHGIKLPITHYEYLKDLKELGICLEICPTTYIKCGTFRDYKDLKIMFEKCLKEDVDITLCTDNSGMHMTRLQDEYERLLIHNIVPFEELNNMRSNAFKHAFGLSQDQKDEFERRMFY